MYDGSDDWFARGFAMTGSNAALRGSLIVLGGAIVYTAIDNAAGGVATLGWQVAPDFFSVEKSQDFLIRDNHARFIGGVWLGLGLFMIASAFWLARLRGVAMAAIGMIFIGALARFGGEGLAQAGSDLALPLALEMVVFPAIALWLWFDSKPSGAKERGN